MVIWYLHVLWNHHRKSSTHLSPHKVTRLLSTILLMLILHPCAWFMFVFAFFNCMYRWNHMVFVFLWFISLSIIYPLDVVTGGMISFLFGLSNIPFTYQWTVRLLPYFGSCEQRCSERWRAYYLSECMFLFSLGEYAEVKSLDYLAILFLGFRGTSIQFSVVYGPTSSAGSFPFLHVLTKICHFLSFRYSHSERYKMGSHCGFNLHFPDSDVENLFMCLLAICISSWKNVCSGPLLIF